jgi:uncharacterized protein (TIGR00369 family)
MPHATIPLPIVSGGPEALFRVGAVSFDGPVVQASMPVGPWTRGADGRTSAGALGVLVDNVLGLAIIATRPPDHWSVSTEISLDVFPELGTAQGRLHAEATVVHTDSTGGHATGRVVDDDGVLVAECGQRGRFVAADASTLTPTRTRIETSDAANLAALLDLEKIDPHGIDVEISPALQNPMRNLHGGITLCLADLLATSTLSDTEGPPLSIVSVQMTYLRPIPASVEATFRPTVLHRGRTLAVVDVAATVDGRLCATSRVVAQQLP